MKVLKKSIALLLNNDENSLVDNKQSAMILLSDCFRIQSEPHVNTSVRLTDTCLYYRTVQINNGEEHKEDDLRVIPVCDIVGCQVEKCESDSAVLLKIFSYPLRAKGKLNIASRRLRRTRKSIVFLVNRHESNEENYALAEKWKRFILWLISSKSQIYNSDATINIPDVTPQQRRLLVLINPASGPGKALEIFEQRVLPIFVESDIRYKVVITNYSKSGINFIKNLTDLLTQWDGIVVVSGDGLLFEVFNGLMQRHDWEQAIKLPIGVIPGGSGNGIAHSIIHATGEPVTSNPVISSALNVVKGRSIPMDLVRIKTGRETIYSCLSVGWGLIADIDIESERLRLVGGARFTIWAVIRTMGLRKYKGKLSYLPLPGYSRPKPPISQNFISVCLPRSNTIDCRPGIRQSNNVQRKSRSRSFNGADGSLSDSTVETNCVSNQNILEEETEIIDTNMKNLNDTNAPKSSLKASEASECDWVTVEGDFVLVYSSYQSHISSDCFFTPGAKFDDGIIWLVYILGSVTRAQIVQFLLSLDNGSHVNLPFVHSVPVRAFKLEPKSKEGRITVDGELIECVPIEAEVLPSIARLMTR